MTFWFILTLDCEFWGETCKNERAFSAEYLLPQHMPRRYWRSSPSECRQNGRLLNVAEDKCASFLQVIHQLSCPPPKPGRTPLCVLFIVLILRQTEFGSINL